MAYYDSGRFPMNYPNSSFITFRGFPESIKMKDVLDIFSKAGDILNARIHKFPYVGWGIVTYTDRKEVREAVKLFDYLNYKGGLIRVRSLLKKTNGCRTVVMEDFESELTEEELKRLFKDYGGEYVSFKLIISESSGNCAVVEFEKEEAAEKTIKQLNFKNIKGQTVTVSPFIPESVREEEEREERGRTVVVSNFSENSKGLELHFANIGHINSVVIDWNEDGSSKFGYVTFVKIQDAAKAIEKFNGHLHDKKRWVVEWAQPEPRCIVVKNLQESVSVDFLNEMFGQFGWVKFCNVWVDSEGTSGFVKFRKHEDAARAVKSMNGKVIARKALSVAFAGSSKPKVAEVDGIT